MINRDLFDLGRLLDAMLDTVFGNVDAWRTQAEIVPDYMPPFPNANTRPSLVVRWGKSFLRYSKGPRQGFMWDVYGDDFMTPELALLALLDAPPPPSALRWPANKETDNG